MHALTTTDITDLLTVTPWQKVFSKFGLSQSEFARAIGCDRSKISKALRSDKGFINGADQERLLRVARELNVALRPEDFLPEVR